MGEEKEKTLLPPLLRTVSAALAQEESSLVRQPNDERENNKGRGRMARDSRRRRRWNFGGVAIPRFFDARVKEQFCASTEYTGCILLGSTRRQVLIRCIRMP